MKRGHNYGTEEIIIAGYVDVKYGEIQTQKRKSFMLDTCSWIMRCRVGREPLIPDRSNPTHQLVDSTRPAEKYTRKPCYCKETARCRYHFHAIIWEITLEGVGSVTIHKRYLLIVNEYFCLFSRSCVRKPHGNAVDMPARKENLT